MRAATRSSGIGGMGARRRPGLRAALGPGRVAAGTTTAIAAAVLTLLAHATTLAAAETPTALVDGLHESLLGVMKEAKTLGYTGRYEKLAPVLQASFDLDFMGSKALGRHWRSLSSDDHARWLETFHRFTIANYAARFNDYSGQTFEVLGEEPATHETIVVLTRITDPDHDNESTRLNYRLRETPAGWRVIDVYLNGSVSELALRRAEFSTAFERNGFDEVLASLESKIQDLSSGRGA